MKVWLYAFADQCSNTWLAQHPFLAKSDILMEGNHTLSTTRTLPAREMSRSAGCCVARSQWQP